MANGSVKFFNAAKGFGFITPEGGAKDVFVPVASVTASGLPTLKPGQIVSFDTEPDGKGPKAVNLKLVAEAPVAPRPAPPPVRENPAPPPREPELARLTLFHDPSLAESGAVLAALRELGHEPRLVDYIAVPPDREVLKNLSLLLRGGDHSLVRKYDSLFLELRLDDRFISDGEFWGGIVEHPTLINGPVLASAHKARVCRNPAAVRAFLGLEPAEEKQAAKPKAAAQAVTAKPDAVPPKAEAKPAEKVPTKTVPAAIAKSVAKSPAKAKAKAKPEPKPTPKPAPKSKTKAAKAVKVAKPKKPAPKPVKKAKPAKKK
jgi:CspA family cold shock protein